MTDIEMQEMNDIFYECWKAAGKHLNNQVDTGIHSWLKATATPPFLEHLSFRLGNQLFFIQVVDVDRKVNGPGSIGGLNYIANGCKGHACLLPMKNRPDIGWVADRSGWGLVDANNGELIDPVMLITDEDIVMTPWEMQDMAVQVVCHHLRKSDYQLMSWQGNPEVDPAIWFIGDSGTAEWIVVRHAKYPIDKADRPANWDEIALSCAKESRIGHFASVSLVNSEVAVDPSGKIPAMPLWRGYGMFTAFNGLE
jgi:hypothetical protein